MTIKSYRDLRLWQAAMELAEWVYRITREFPRPESYGMTAQLRRGVTQIPSRIAEGHASEELRDYLSQPSKAQALLADLETQTRSWRGGSATCNPSRSSTRSGRPSRLASSSIRCEMPCGETADTRNP